MGSLIVCVGNLFIEISSDVIADPADAVLFVPFPDLLPDIGLRVICDLEKFRMFPEIFHVFGRDLFAVAESLLSVVCWVLKPFVEVKFQMIPPPRPVYHKHTTHATYI